MRRNLQMQGAKNVGSEQAYSSDDGQSAVLLRTQETEVMANSIVQQVRRRTREDPFRKVVKEGIQSTLENFSSSGNRLTTEAIEVMESIVQQATRRTMEDLFREVVKEEIQSALENFLIGGNWIYTNEVAVSKERSLHLKFLDEVSAPVLTGKAIEGKGGTPMRVALVDKLTGQFVESGPESSAKVEILVLEASNGDDDEHNGSLQNFNNSIIKEGDKKKPHFAKSYYIYLKDGIGTLCNAKLAHDSNWMKNCKCRLGARIVENFSGIMLQEAWTESFMVSDSRSKLYKKHYPPSLSDPVWRLEKIGKDGAPCKRLNKNKVSTVQDFLIFHSIDPQRLKQMVRAGTNDWKAMVDHAQTCIINDKRTCLYKNVVFDVVEGPKGVISDSHYIPDNQLSEAEKDCACKLLLSAFENRKDITFFNDETTLQHQFPCRASCAATNSTIHEDLPGCDLTAISESINYYDPAEPGTLSRCISPSVRSYGNSNYTCSFGSLMSTAMGQLHGSCLDFSRLDPSQSSELESCLERFGDNEKLVSLFCPESNDRSETPTAEPHSCQQNNAGRIQLAGAVAVMLWMLRLRKRIIALGGMHVSKKQRT